MQESTKGAVNDLYTLYYKLRLKKEELLSRITSERDGVIPVTSDNPSSFIGLGFSSSIAGYLRFNGPVRWRDWSQRRTVSSIRKLWHAKVQCDHGKKTWGTSG